MILTAIAVLLFCIGEQFNPVIKEYGSFAALTKQSYLDTISLFAQKIANLAATPGIMALNIAIVILVIVAAAALLGVFGAGFGHTFYMAFLNDKKKKGEFKSGINRHYLKMIGYYVCLLFFTLLMLVAIVFLTIPAILSVKLVLAGDSSSIFSMLILCILTVAVLFFAVVFFTMYMTYIYPALIAYRKGGVKVAFKMVNSYCWYLIPRTTLFLFVMALIQLGLLAVGYGNSGLTAQIIVLVVNWILKTVTVFIYLHFSFNAFKGMKEDLFPSYSSSQE